MTRVKMLVFPLFIGGFIGLFLFGAAGRIDVPAFWLYAGIWVAMGLIVVLTLDEDLLKERMKPAGKSRDNLEAIRWLAAVSMAGFLVLAGLHQRFGWPGSVPVAVQTLGFTGIVGSVGISIWAMRVNRFFSSAVRIQTDRGHEVISTGPYRFVRHPGYIAFITQAVAGPLALGSFVALIPTILWVGIFARRTALEDAMLRDELPGYRDYSLKVPYRLIPGIW